MSKTALRVSTGVLLIFFWSGLIFSQGTPGLSEKEVRNSPQVRFLNRSGRRAPNSVKQQQITEGRGIAKEVIEKGASSESRNIRIQRHFDANQQGLGADIATVSSRASYSHINAIRRVIAGFLMDSFEYNETDAVLLSRFILYYNANIRLRGTAGLETRYQKIVIDNIDPKIAGIDRSYRNWAGKTQLIIPIVSNVVRPGEKDIDNEEIRKNSGKVTPEEKKQLEELEKRRREEDQKKIEEKKKEIAKEKEEIKKEKEKNEEEKKKADKDVEDQKKVVEKTQKDPTKTPEDVKKEEEELKKKEEVKKEADKKGEEIAKKETENKEKEKKVAEEEKKTKETGDKTDTKTDPKKSDTTDPAKKDDKEEPGKKEPSKGDTEKDPVKEPTKKKDSGNVVAEKILFLRVLRYIEGGHYNNELWRIDTAKDDTVDRGPFTQICGRKFVIVPNEGILVIGYSGDNHQEGHQLIMLDLETLNKTRNTKESVHWRTPMILRGDKIYAFELYEDQYHLTRFNADLTLDKRSESAVSPDSDVTFFKDKIYLTGKPSSEGASTTIRVINEKDMKLLKTITPNDENQS